MFSIICAVFLFLFLLFAPSSIFVAGSSSQTSFSYDPSASNGPADWGNLAIDNNACSGNSNSPIALNSTNHCDIVGDYIFEAGNCNVSDLRFELLSNVVEAVYPESSVCTVGTMQIPAVATTTDGSSMIFELKQFHIHASSEHSLDQEFFDAELHIVHQQRDNNNQLAVIGIFIVSDSEDDNLDFDQMLNEWEVEYSLMLDTCSNTRRQLSSTLRKTTTTTDDTSFNIYNLIPQGTSFYRYNGSLTTPPCSEIVDWSVAEIPLFISVHQYRKLMSIILNYRHSETCELASIASPSGTTSRPIQPLNQRHVQHICASSSSSTSQESGVEYTMAQSSAATNAATAGIVIICLVFVIVTMV